MRIIAGMEKLKFKRQFQVRSPVKVQSDFKARVVLLTASRRLTIEPTLENVTAAFWHWWSQLPYEEAEEFVAKGLPALKDYARSHPDPSEEEKQSEEMEMRVLVEPPPPNPQERTRKSSRAK